MVRTLDAPLTAALGQLTRRPAIQVQIQDQIPHFTSYQAPGNSDAWHDAAVAADNSIIRAYISRGGSGFDRTIFVQKITDPTNAAQWSSWTALPGGSGNMFQDGGIAVSVWPDGSVHIYAQQGTGGNAIYNWYSNDNGASWNFPGAIVSPPGGALCKGIGSAGNNDVFFIYDVAGGENLGACFYSGGAWGSLHAWTLPVLSYGAGCDAAWNGSVYTIVYSDSYTLSSCTYNPNTNAWSAGSVIAPATSTAVGRLAPRLQYFNGVYWLICIESDTGALTGTVYSYPRVRQSSDLIHWSTGWILHPLTASYGACIIENISQSAGTRFYAFTMASVYSARAYSVSNPWQYLDCSNLLLSYSRHEQGEKPAKLELVLDNNQGALNGLISSPFGSNYQPIGPNASIVLSEGYYVGSPSVVKDMVQVGTYRINQILIERSPEQNQVKLVAYDLSRDLDRQCRWQMTYLGQTVAWLVAEVCSRAGLLNYAIPQTANTGQPIPQFVLHAGQTYRQALNELCNTYGLWYFLDQSEVMQFRELSASDPSVWSYQPEIEIVVFGTDDERANHVIVSGKPPTGGSAYALTEAEAYDDTNVALVLVERLLHHVDQKLTSAAQCAARAASLLAQEQRGQVAHTVTVPPNPALQLYDGITLTDSAAPTGSGQSSVCRIIQSQVVYDAARAEFEQHLALEGM